MEWHEEIQKHFKAVATNGSVQHKSHASKVIMLVESLLTEQQNMFRERIEKLEEGNKKPRRMKGQMMDSEFNEGFYNGFGIACEKILASLTETKV